MAAIGRFRRDVSRRPSRPRAAPARLQFSQSSVPLRGGEGFEIGGVASDSEEYIVAWQLSPEPEQGVLVIDIQVLGMFWVFQVKYAHSGRESPGMKGPAAFLPGGRLLSHNPPAWWGPSVRDSDINHGDPGIEDSYSLYYVSKLYSCRAAACLYLDEQY